MQECALELKFEDAQLWKERIELLEAHHERQKVVGHGILDIETYVLLQTKKLPRRVEKAGKILEQLKTDLGMDVLPHHIEHRHRLDVQHLTVGVELHLVSCGKLDFGVNAVALEELNVLLVKIVGNAVGSCRKIEQPAFFRLSDPCVIVAVAAENYALVLFNDVADEIVQGGLEILRLL